MRVRSVLCMAGAGLVASTIFAPAADAALTQTAVTVVRPVTAAGHAVAGYTVKRETTGSVYCSFPQPSPAAENRNILQCDPSSEYAPACWRSATPHRVLCLRDARKKRLVKIRTVGAIASVKAPAHPIPLDMRLGNGAYCTLRVGGAGAALQGHPHYGVVYYCTDREAVWARFGDRRAGIDKTHRVWRVQVAPDNGQGPLRTRRVAHAWFVGTHR